MAGDGERDRRWLPVTVIVTVWNRERSIAAAVDSVLAQTCTDVNVVVVDDGSSDGTPGVLARYQGDPRVRVVRHAQNRGVTAARNTGLAAMDERTAAFTFLDSDDTFAPDAIASLVAGFDAVGGPWSEVVGWCRDTHSGEIIGRLAAPPGAAAAGDSTMAGVVTYDDALCGRFRGDFVHLVRRDILGTLRFDERASGGEAAFFWQLLRTAPARVIPYVAANVDRSGVDRVSVVRYSVEASVRRMWTYQAVLDVAGADLRRASREQFGFWSAGVAKWAALSGDWKRARRAALHALRDVPGLRSALWIGVWLLPGRVLRRAALARWRPRTGGDAGRVS